MNENFLGPWAERYVTVTENVQPSLKEQLEADINTILDTYKRSNLYPFFLFYVNKHCDSPSIAMITRDTVWNNRSLKVFLLPHHKSPVPRGQFNDTTVRVPNNNLLCSRRGCNCLKQHVQKLDKKHILHILVEEKEEDGETILKSVFAKDDKAKSERDFTIYHLPKSQIHFLTEFNERRINVVGDLRMLSNMVDLS